MRRVERLRIVKRAAEDIERRCGEALAASEQAAHGAEDRPAAVTKLLPGEDAAAATDAAQDTPSVQSNAALTHAGAPSVEFSSLLAGLAEMGEGAPPTCAPAAPPPDAALPTLMPADAATAPAATPSAVAAAEEAGAPSNAPQRTDAPLSAAALFGAWGLPGMCVPTLQPAANVGSSAAAPQSAVVSPARRFKHG
jgi:hypothetical protein